jgi:hypothetical protein
VVDANASALTAMEAKFDTSTHTRDEIYTDVHNYGQYKADLTGLDNTSTATRDDLFDDHGLILNDTATILADIGILEAKCEGSATAATTRFTNIDTALTTMEAKFDTSAATRDDIKAETALIYADVHNYGQYKADLTGLDNTSTATRDAIKGVVDANASALTTMEAKIDTSTATRDQIKAETALIYADVHNYGQYKADVANLDQAISTTQTAIETAISNAQTAITDAITAAITAINDHTDTCPCGCCDACP